MNYYDPYGLEKWDYDGYGDTGVCDYYDKRADETCGDLKNYYETAANICRGNRNDVNLLMDIGITHSWADDSTSSSQSEIYNQVRNDLVISDSDLVNKHGKDGVTGNMIDSYHDDAFNNAGIGSAYYGGNLWPQGVFPNPVPFDPDGKGEYDPRSSDNSCSCGG